MIGGIGGRSNWTGNHARLAFCWLQSSNGKEGGEKEKQANETRTISVMLNMGRNNNFCADFASFFVLSGKESCSCLKYKICLEVRN